MTVKPFWHKAIQIVFVIGTIIGVLLLGRIIFVMSMAQFVNSESRTGEHDPAELYYLIQAYSGDFMEPYKAFYNAGTAYAENKDYASAEIFLTAALGKVDYEYNECLIRNNLAITYEKQGDYYKLSDQPDIAANYYDKAVTTVTEAPLACFPPPPMAGDMEDSEDGNPNESDEGLPSDNATPDTSKEGENLEKTEETSQDKGDSIRGEKSDEVDGKSQVENETDQSTGETGNREDQEQQEGNSSGQPVDRPW